MLTRLLKHEFRATARIFLPFYLVLILFALINRFLSFEMLSRLESMTPPFGIAGAVGSLVLLLRLIYFILVAGVLVATLLVMIQRFNKNLFGDEGYLMLTLPVPLWQHIVSKLITATVWVIASGLVTTGSILLLSAKAAPWPRVWETLFAFRDIFGSAGLFLFPGAALLTLVSSILMIYAAIALGHLSPRYRLLASLAWYAVLSFALKALLLGISMALFLSQTWSIDFADIAADPTRINLIIAWFWLLPTAILSGCFFFITNHILNRRLNLE
jgi:hypothetical protein